MLSLTLTTGCACGGCLCRGTTTSAEYPAVVKCVQPPHLVRFNVLFMVQKVRGLETMET